MKADWVIEVLRDIREFASQNGLFGLAEQIDDAIMVGAEEIAELAHACEGLAADAGPERSGAGRSSRITIAPPPSLGGQASTSLAEEGVMQATDARAALGALLGLQGLSAPIERPRLSVIAGGGRREEAASGRARPDLALVR